MELILVPAHPHQKLLLLTALFESECMSGVRYSIADRKSQAWGVRMGAGYTLCENEG